MKSNLLLLLAAAIWGFAFAAQRKGMEHVGPYTFNALRFLLGAAVLAPLLALRLDSRADPVSPRPDWKTSLRYGAIAGFFLFLGITFQQKGLVFATAAKAGFITGLYVIIVPLMGILLWKQKVAGGTWAGAILALAGLYLLSFEGSLQLAPGDALLLIGAFCWAAHVQAIGKLSPRIPAIRLAVLQFLACSVYSWVFALGWESIDWRGVRSALIPILYTGILSSGVGFTIQIFVQRKVNPSHVAIIMSLETVFAALGGWLFLSETLDTRDLFGCAFMFAGMVVSQLGVFWGRDG